MKYRVIVLYFIILVFSGKYCPLNSQVIDDSLRSELLESMKMASKSWNIGDMPGFMHNYWKSDSLRFIGKRGITFGWENTLKNYIKGYPDSGARGILEFNILSIEYLGKEHILMLGKWIIERKNEKIDGSFSLIWKKINNKWFIIFDHSS